MENENRLKYIDIEEGEEKENKNGDNSNEPMTIEVIMEKEPIRREEEKDDGFRVVTRKRRNKAFEKIGRVKGVFKDFKNMSEEEVEMVETKDQRFSGRQEEYVVTAKIKPEHITTDKRTNYVKIIKAILKDRIDPVNVLDNSFAASDIIFKDKEKANKCLSIEDKEERIITYGISNRTAQCRGVITSWDGDLLELSEAIEDKDQVIKVQRLRKRVWSVEEGEYGWEPTRHVIITLKGNRVPNEISIFKGLATLSVRPFVDTVVQCFYCYGYDHSKDTCKKRRLCMISGESFHGKCDRKEKCSNCGEGHKATDRRCKIYKRQEQMNKMKAEERITPYETKIKIQNFQRKEDNNAEKNGRREREKEMTGTIRRMQERDGSRTRRGTTEGEQRSVTKKWSDVVQGGHRETEEDNFGTIETGNNKRGRKDSRTMENVTENDSGNTEEEWSLDKEERLCKKVEKMVMEKMNMQMKKMAEAMDEELEKMERKIMKKLEEKDREMNKIIENLANKVEQCIEMVN